MNNMSRMSFSEIRNKKIGIENSMDKLAGELNEVNKELTKRFGSFEALVCRAGDDCDSEDDW
jgi:hypothetical protein